jgi:RNA polymerase sigma factor FliA
MATNLVNPSSGQMALDNYFGLVQAIAGKIKRRLPAHVDVDDLVQTGMIGLLEASSRYDASRMVDFASYANSRITGAILDELRKWDTCSRQDRRTAREIESAKQNLRAEKRCEPAREEIAQAVGMGLAEYDRTLHRLESGKQATMLADDSESEHGDDMDRIAGSEVSPFEALLRKEDSSRVRFYLAHLKPRHRAVLELYYFKEIGLKEIGRQLGVGEARVSQIHKSAVTELKRLLREQPVGTNHVSTMIQ